LIIVAVPRCAVAIFSRNFSSRGKRHSLCILTVLPTRNVFPNRRRERLEVDSSTAQVFNKDRVFVDLSGAYR
jgi:hypothetical protein